MDDATHWTFVPDAAGARVSSTVSPEQKTTLDGIRGMLPKIKNHGSVTDQEIQRFLELLKQAGNQSIPQHVVEEATGILAGRIVPLLNGVVSVSQFKTGQFK